MNCQEFNQIWNELLDAETVASHQVDHTDNAALTARSAGEEAARAHASSCPMCREVGVRNEALRSALRSWTRLPLASPTPELVDRIVTATRPGLRWRGAIPLAASVLAVAAGLFLAFGPIHWQAERPRAGRLAGQPGGFHPGGAERTAVPQPDARLLRTALADATEATWDLARTTSEPAARLGRQVLEAATQPEVPARLTTTDDSLDRGESALASIPAMLRDLPESPPGAALLQDVGDGLAESFRPVSATARQAFEFLRTPSLGKTGSPVASPASKGA